MVARSRHEHKAVNCQRCEPETSLQGDAQRHARLKSDYRLCISAAPPKFAFTLRMYQTSLTERCLMARSPPSARVQTLPNSSVLAGSTVTPCHPVPALVGRTRMHGNNAHEKGPLIEINLSIAGVQRRHEKRQYNQRTEYQNHQADQ